MDKLNKNNQAGFTIVEVIVATFVFSIISLAIISIFSQILKIERRVFAVQEMQENSLFVLELMAREIRVSKIESQESLDCSRTSLIVNHPVNGIVSYSLNGGVVRRTASGVTTDLTAGNLNFTRLNFCVKGSAPSDNKQVRVAILTSVQNIGGQETFKFDLETTITSRDLLTELE